MSIKTKYLPGGPAREFQAADYPPEYRGRVPRTVRMLRTVHSDLPWPMERGPVAVKGREYRAWTNSHGAVSAWVDGELLGLKPGEFEVSEGWKGGADHA